MQLYYFYDPADDDQYLANIEGDVTPDKAKAGQFTERDWRDWGRAAGFERIPVPEDVKLRAAGAPMLPGIE